MARTPIVGGPLDGEEYVCSCPGECTCEAFGCGTKNGNKILDGYVLWQMYRQVGGVFRPSHIKKQVMVLEDSCPRCSRPMPMGTKTCLNCGACMGIDFNQ